MPDLHSPPAPVGCPRCADLWAEVRRLRAALDRIMELDADSRFTAGEQAWEIARAALAASAPGGEG